MSARIAPRHSLGLLLAVMVGLPLPAYGQSGDDATIERDGRRVPTRIRPPAARPAAGPSDGQAAGRAAESDAHEPAIEETPLNGSDRVIVVEPGYDPRSRHFRPDRRAWSRGLLLWAPYGGAYGYGPLAMQRALWEAYLAGREDERYLERRRFNQEDMQRRAERALSQYDKALQEGLRWLSQGDAARAAIQLTLASELDQGDPACRIHLAQARLALRHYDDAAAALRRALELQPKLAYLDLDLDRYYAEPGTLARLTDELARHMREHRTSADVHFLRGFLEFQRGNLAAAHEAFRRVARVSPDDELARSLVTISKPPRQ